MSKRFTIQEGLYLVIDPAMPEEILLTRTEAALRGGVNLIQVWNHWPEGMDRTALVKKLAVITRANKVPLLVNESIDLLTLEEVDGIHFDHPPADIAVVRSIRTKPILIGITCGNDISRVQWAVDQQLDYISFCSVFPSSSVNTCDLVRREVITTARALTSMPIFLSGGITLDNIGLLKTTGMNGVAVISGIMSKQDTEEVTLQYKHALQNKA